MADSRSWSAPSSSRADRAVAIWFSKVRSPTVLKTTRVTTMPWNADSRSSWDASVTRMTPHAPINEMTMRLGRIQRTARGARGDPELSLGSTTSTPASANREIAASTSEPSGDCDPTLKRLVPSNVRAEDPRAMAQARRETWTALGHHKANTPHPTTTRIAAAVITAVSANPHTEGRPKVSARIRTKTAAPARVETSRISERSSALPSRMCSKKSTPNEARKVRSNRISVPANNCPYGSP